ncbi:MAG: alkaline phosphatase family protein, partial [Acidobacteria bacterium]|nr:alkaline phosphatase family protein [Acidobacteriota bacterium]
MQSFIERRRHFLKRHPGLETALLGFLPGGLFAVHLCLLLLFLNPELPLRPALLAGLALSYGLLLGGLTSLMSWILVRRRPRRARRWLPWGLTGAVALASVLAASHASRFAFYLPPGINNRLIKGALLTGVAALILFYTSLLHSVGRRPYGRRSRWGIVLLCLASVYVMAERRFAFHAGPAPIRVNVPAPPLEPPRLLVVGVEGATLDALLPLAEQGRTPFLAEILRSGATARLVPLVPDRHLPAWTTLATGKYPYRHGVTDPHRFRLPRPMEEAELQLLPSAIGFRFWGLFGAEPRAVRSSDQRAMALWQILVRRGSDSGTVGWPAPGPVPPELRFALAQEFFNGGEDATTA